MESSQPSTSADVREGRRAAHRGQRDLPPRVLRPSERSNCYFESHTIQREREECCALRQLQRRWVDPGDERIHWSAHTEGYLWKDFDMPL
jgi:hypothetical protein